MRSRTSGLQRTPVNKLCDIFANVIETALTEKALRGTPCGRLSRSQWEGVLFVQRHDNCSIRQLAEGLGVSHPAAVKMVERLVRKHLLQRHESEADHRVVQLRLSELGRKCVEQVREQRARMLEEVMAAMNAQETECLVVGLQSFLQAALQDPETAQAVCLRCGSEHVAECLVNQSLLNPVGR